MRRLATKQIRWFVLVPAPMLCSFAVFVSGFGLPALDGRLLLFAIFAAFAMMPVLLIMFCYAVIAPIVGTRGRVAMRGACWVFWLVVWSTVEVVANERFVPEELPNGIQVGCLAAAVAMVLVHASELVERRLAASHV